LYCSRRVGRHVRSVLRCCFYGRLWARNSSCIISGWLYRQANQCLAAYAVQKSGAPHRYGFCPAVYPPRIRHGHPVFKSRAGHNDHKYRNLCTMKELIEKYNTPVPRYTSYPTVPNWKPDTFQKESYLNRLTDGTAQANADGMSVYVHLRFCESLCTYCGCNTRSEERRVGKECGV